ncbi:hypothetical protein IHE45_14G097000 [Dioscorea alata]|uniref:Uncharacterized protein n=1 Tax=Dioscorea alata TaxID=55571 RepID=A0ACB7UTR7_DIOAL|nr:hypothetical protein IHE45_14G097000 [Dioscorea alata]
MRAAEKDNHYASYVHDACRDAIRHLFGTRAAVAYQSERPFIGMESPTRKKGQKWGREKGSWRNDNDDNVCTAEANEINDEVSLVNDQIDFEKLMPLTSQPKEGDVLAYRLVELSSSWTPELSSFPVGKVSSYDPISKNVILLPVPNFPVFPDKEKEEEEFLWQTNVSLYKEDGSLEVLGILIFSSF